MGALHPLISPGFSLKIYIYIYIFFEAQKVRNLKQHSVQQDNCFVQNLAVVLNQSVGKLTPVNSTVD